MAKNPISEKLTTTHQLSIEGTLNLDNLAENMFIAEIEDLGEKDLVELLKKFNGQFVKLSITNKIEETPEE